MCLWEKYIKNVENKGKIANYLLN